jgi:hypothetical protein
VLKGFGEPRTTEVFGECDLSAGAIELSELEMK